VDTHTHAHTHTRRTLLYCKAVTRKIVLVLHCALEDLRSETTPASTRSGTQTHFPPFKGGFEVDETSPPPSRMKGVKRGAGGETAGLQAKRLGLLVPTFSGYGMVLTAQG